MADYGFLADDRAPDTVNPSLWRQSQLNCRHGLYEVVPGIYQIRGFDISNMTLIEGNTGVIVIDPLVTVEVARAGIELYFAHRGRRPVAAVIYTHSHTDHWGGVKGIITQDDVDSGRVPVIAPQGFVEAIAQENVLAGTAMVRRAQYQFGVLLPKGAQGQVDAGLGKTLSSGLVTLIAPTDLISRDLEERTVDGVKIIFLMAPGSAQLPQSAAVPWRGGSGLTVVALYRRRVAYFRRCLGGSDRPASLAAVGQAGDPALSRQAA
jgi:alkyl sulfatase BDS1-like metallo-beta-lactamase superfamily hydrolase